MMQIFKKTIDYKFYSKNLRKQTINLLYRKMIKQAYTIEKQISSHIGV